MRLRALGCVPAAALIGGLLVSAVPGRAAAAAAAASAPPPAIVLARRYLAAGQAAEKAGRFADAERDYLAGEVADPTFADTFYALARMDARRGNLIGADIQLRTLVGLDPRLLHAHAALADLQMQEKLYDDAAKNYEAELLLDPRNGAVKAARDRAVALYTRQQLAARGSSNSPAPRRRPTPNATPSVTPAPQATISPQLAAEAKGYVAEVASDFNFTGALPVTDLPASTASFGGELRAALANKATSEVRIVDLGTKALLVGQLDLARDAFDEATKRDAADWLAPYLAGLTAQIAGDESGAKRRFDTSLARKQRPETYTSLAVLALAAGKLDEASADAGKAVTLNGGYEPGRFVAGMVAIVRGDAAGAHANLTAAVALGGAPGRAAEFRDAVRPPGALAPLAVDSPLPARTPGSAL